MNTAEKPEMTNIKDTIGVLWQKKRLIAILTVVLTAAAGSMILHEKPTWEIEAAFQPSRQFLPSQRFGYVEQPIVEPKQIALKIVRKSYNDSVAAALRINERFLPCFGADNPRGTKSVRVWARDQDPAAATRALQALLSRITNELDVLLEDANARLKNQVAEKKKIIAENDLEIEKKTRALFLLDAQRKRVLDQAASDENRIRISENRIRNLADIVMAAFQKNKEMENRFKRAQGRKLENLDDSGLTAFSREIRENLKIIATFEEKKAEEEKVRDTLRQNVVRSQKILSSTEEEISDTKDDIAKIDRLSATLREQMQILGRSISGSSRCGEIQAPTRKKEPVGPNRWKNIGLALILGFLLSASLAVFLEHTKRTKNSEA